MSAAAQDPLEAHRHLLAKIVETTPNLIYIYDIIEHRNVYANREVLDFLGYTSEQILAFGPALMQSILHSDDAQAVALHHSRFVSIADNVVLEIEYRMKHASGEWRWLRSRDVLFARDSKGSGKQILGTAEDFTERKKSEEALHNVQKLESLGLLAGGIAHDFNNLLGGIFGYIDMASESTKENNVSSYLAKALNTIDRARGLTQQLLTFAKGGIPIQKIGPLFPFVQESAQFALSGSNASLHSDVSQDLWACNFDKNQIGQVIDNVIINAQQAMPDGGTIVLLARNISLGEQEHPLLAKGDYVKISVKDSGIGIPPKVLPRIFDPFFTTKAMGHGLGLATCYSIVNRHGGCIDVVSEPDKGSTFHIFLPAAAGSIDAPSEEAPPQHKGSGTILLMDDEEVMRDTISAMLMSLGYTVVSKVNGNDAVSFFTTAAKAKQNIVATILDLTVPGGMGGKEAGFAIRKMDSCVPVFITSGYTDDPVMANPTAYGFTASICKPFRKAELEKMLAPCLGSPGIKAEAV